MIRRILDLFKRKQPPPAAEVDEEAANRWYDEKSALMESILGKEHDMVMHAIIPYAIGGGLDLYYYPNDIEGVAVATKELSDSIEDGSANDVYRLYEIAMFTKYTLNLDEARDEDSQFGRAHSNINAILNVIAPYSAQAKLNPRETCEFPAEMERLGGKCLIFDAYKLEVSTPDFGVLSVIEIFRSEMDFAREHGGASLIQKLKDANHYPYSDMEREPVA